MEDLYAASTCTTMEEKPEKNRCELQPVSYGVYFVENAD